MVEACETKPQSRDVVKVLAHAGVGGVAEPAGDPVLALVRLGFCESGVGKHAELARGEGHKSPAKVERQVVVRARILDSRVKGARVPDVSGSTDLRAEREARASSCRRPQTMTHDAAIVRESVALLAAGLESRRSEGTPQLSD